MDVKFTQTTSEKLSSLSIINGQLIYLIDKDASYYDIGGARRPIASVKLVNALPTSAQVQEGMLYIVISNDGKADASIWNPSTSSFASLSGHIATTSSVGLVKPDGTTITITSDGTISCHAEVTTLPASNITFDNTTSGLASTAVQGALDEVSVTASGAATSAAAASAAAAGAATSAAAAQATASGASTAVAALELRVAALEALAERVLIVEDDNE